MKKTPVFMLVYFLLAILLSCEKIEFPVVENDRQEVSKTDSGEDKGDSTQQSSNADWGYNCTIDLYSGEIIDSSTVVGGDLQGVLGEGTEGDPYTVHDFVTYNLYAGTSVEQISLDDVWLCGYIVGYIQGRSMSKSVFEPGNVATNIILGGSPNENDYSLCVPVQLPSSPHAEIRQYLNLRDNPLLLGQKLLICGTATKYMGVLGIKSPKYYRIE